MRGFSEMPLHPQENTPSKKEESFLSKVKKSPMAKAAMVAAGLHVAVPGGIEATRTGVGRAGKEGGGLQGGASRSLTNGGGVGWEAWSREGGGEGCWVGGAGAPVAGRAAA